MTDFLIFMTFLWAILGVGLALGVLANPDGER